MTNDFAVVEQQQRKSPVWPAVGAVGGAVAGYAIGNRRAAKSHDDLVKEVKDTATFSNKPEGERELWENAQKAQKEVERLEKELADASKASVTGKPLDELNAAKEALQKEIDRLQALENAKFGGSVDANFPKAADIPTFANVQKANPNSINYVYAEGKHAGKEMSNKEAEKLFNDLKGRIGKAEGDLDAVVKPMENKKDGWIKGMRTEFGKIQTKTASYSDEAFSNYLSDMYTFDAHYNRVPKADFEPIWNLAVQQCGDPTKIDEAYLIKNDPEKLISIGHIKERGEKVDSSHVERRLKNADGEWNKYIIAKEDVKNLIADEQRSMSEKVTSTADELFSTMRDVIERERAIKPSELKEKFANLEDIKVRQNIIENTGLYDAGKGELKVAELFGTHGYTLKGVQAARADQANFKAVLDAQRKVVENTIKAANPGIKKEELNKKVSEEMLNKAYLKSSLGIDLGKDISIGKAEEMLGARANTLKEFEKYLTEYNKETNKLLEETPAVKEMIEKIAEKKANFEPLTKAQETFVNQFGDIEVLNKDKKKVKISEFGTSGATGSGKTITADDVAKSFRDKVAEKQKAYDKAVSENGAVNEEVKKKAEEALNKGKKDAEEAMTKLTEKLGKGGTKGKIIAALIGAGALGLAGWLIAPKKTKEA